MNNSEEILKKILKDFLANETAVTDRRILSIQHFLFALNAAVDQYIASSVQNNVDVLNKEKLLAILDDVADVYRQEIADLLIKRGKIAKYNNLFDKQRGDESLFFENPFTQNHNILN